MIKYLSENEELKVYSIYENVYLKFKEHSNKLSEYEENDRHIAWHYGDPNCAIILHSNKHIIVGGSGLTIYDIENDSEKDILADPENISWIFALYQDEQDDQILEFRFITYYQNEKLRVYKMNLESMKIELME